MVTLRVNRPLVQVYIHLKTVQSSLRSHYKCHLLNLMAFSYFDTSKHTLPVFNRSSQDKTSTYHQQFILDDKLCICISNLLTIFYFLCALIVSLYVNTKTYIQIYLSSGGK